jgi:hypothetical protein
MKLEGHVQKLGEHMAGLEWGVRQNNGSAVGFHASAGSVELLSTILHRLQLVSPGFQVNHTWFRSRHVMEAKFNFDFPKKAEILDIMEEIEELRNPLCYGVQEPGKVMLIAERFHKLRGIVEGVTGDQYG